MDLYQIIKRPLITEKGMMKHEEDNTIVLRVDRRANKLQIKEAVETLFNVSVVKVNTLNVQGKKRRVRFREGKKPDWKRAYVTLQEGENVPFFEGV